MGYTCNGCALPLPAAVCGDSTEMNVAAHVPLGCSLPTKQRVGESNNHSHSRRTRIPTRRWYPRVSEVPWNQPPKRLIWSLYSSRTAEVAREATNRAPWCGCFVSSRPKGAVGSSEVPEVPEPVRTANGRGRLARRVGMKTTPLRTEYVPRDSL